ncbi:MAG: sugar phosphate nucleotidyltransferase [Chloroflexota bacterium]|nr:sugar phosphate nucleotidyltransferase [Chloroflexota bacterium]MDE2841072.1 sugar phosphate nucleotidyltransferase [Chloroflexota bacterium]
MAQQSHVSKAVILVAGLGTRLLPATKSQPKEMLPVGRKPVVQYVVEEMEQAGINQILFVTGRKKWSIEDHFDRDPELEERLGNDDLELAERLPNFDTLLHVFYTRQSVQTGQADAVRLAQEFVGDEPFVVAFGDTIIKGGNLLRRMVESHAESGAVCTMAVERVAPQDAHRYGVVKPTGDAGPDFSIEGIVEKPPRGAEPSNYAVVPRYIMNKEIFEATRLTLPGKGNELWLADSIEVLIKQQQLVRCVQLASEEVRYDIGNFETYFKAFIDFALTDEKYGYLVRQHLLRKTASL